MNATERAEWLGKVTTAAGKHAREWFLLTADESGQCMDKALSNNSRIERNGGTPATRHSLSESPRQEGVGQCGELDINPCRLNVGPYVWVSRFFKGRCKH